MQLSEIQLPLKSVDQILRKTATSGYSRRVLNEDVEEFIVDAAQSCPRKNAFVVRVILPLKEIGRASEVETAIAGHFAYLRKRAEKKRKHTLQIGWRSLFIGFAFLILVFVLTRIGDRFLPTGGVAAMIRESLIILGWVAMWRPADLLLYEWYQFKRDATLFARLENSKFQFMTES